MILVHLMKIDLRLIRSEEPLADLVEADLAVAELSVLRGRRGDLSSEKSAENLMSKTYTAEADIRAAGPEFLPLVSPQPMHWYLRVDIPFSRSNNSRIHGSSPCASWMLPVIRTAWYFSNSSSFGILPPLSETRKTLLLTTPRGGS
jgi:hypothetical protein